MNIDFTKVIPVSEIVGKSKDETEGLLSYLREAEEVINFYSWHNGIVNSFFGIGVSGIFAVFLFEIIPNREDVDSFVWVIVGDIPPAYITCEDAPNPACALDGYIGAMKKWVNAAKSGESFEYLIPVNVAATPENGEQLDTRLKFLDDNILVNYKDDLS